MIQQAIPFKTKGMNQDLSASAFNAEFAFENKNLRLATNEGNTALSWVTEKGPKQLELKEYNDISKDTSIVGTTIGTAVIKNTLVLFTHDVTVDTTIDKKQKLQEQYDDLKSQADTISANMTNNRVAQEAIAGQYGTMSVTFNAVYDLSEPEVTTYIPYRTWLDDAKANYMEAKACINEDIATLNSLLPEAKQEDADNINTILAIITKADQSLGEQEQEYQRLLLEYTALQPQYTTLVAEYKEIQKKIDAIVISVVDRIYTCNYNEDKTALNVQLLYSGNLNFSVSNPIETLVSYEAENIQKVYWIDGINQPRIINIAAIDKINNYTDTSFDFSPTLELNETITVEKLFEGLGTFAPGVIQYAFTYYNKFCQESAIFYTTPLQYIAFKDRGGSPEEMVPNSFKIKILELDNTHFEYLRIYSIHRTSLNAVPTCKRVVDLKINNNASLEYTDDGIGGDSIDPTELLYKSSYPVTANTFEQKDNTLFLGGLTMLPLKNTKLEETTRENLVNSIASCYRYAYSYYESSTQGYVYYPQLALRSVKGYYYGDDREFYYTSIDNGNTPCGGFKKGNTYRLGIQFQHYTGIWSEPIYLTDLKETKLPKQDTAYNLGMQADVSDTLPKNAIMLALPSFVGTIPAALSKEYIAKGYLRARAVVCFPNYQDRDILLQGVINPIVYTDEMRNQQNTIGYSSWFFRPFSTEDAINNGSPAWYGDLTGTAVSEKVLKHKRWELYGSFGDREENVPTTNTMFRTGAPLERDTSNGIGTLHSPDLAFDSQYQILNYNNSKLKRVGTIKFEDTLASLELEVSTPSISGCGLVKNKLNQMFGGSIGYISDIWAEDCLVDDDNTETYPETGGMGRFGNNDALYYWNVFLWQRNGSLNNDMERPSGKGVQSLLLQKKIVANLRYASTKYVSGFESVTPNNTPQVFSGEEDSYIKFANKLYAGNVDSVALPTGDTSYASIYLDHPEKEDVDKAVGNIFSALRVSRDPVRIKYKSTAHMVVDYKGFITLTNNGVAPKDNYKLGIFEIVNPVDDTQRFGGTSIEALRENTWVPCGEPVRLSATEDVHYLYAYGDTYYQRYDCLKTYAFSDDDINQVVEIGSFMLETYKNIDGRYDRNRGQTINTHMSPRNFNLYNEVYSQVDNFFNYKIQSTEDDVYAYPNDVTWTKTKQSGADIDAWTNITLASTLELDGDKGKVTKLCKLDNTLLAFQDTGISQILYNENVQIASKEGVPIEITNSDKVQGKRYLSNTIGCSNKWSVTTTPAGIYFIDSYNKSINLYNGKLVSLSDSAGFNTWAKNNISLQEDSWNPIDFNDFVSHYDSVNQDVLFTNKDTALAWSEKLQTFTSFYNYGNTSFLCSLQDANVWLINSDDSTSIWKHNAGEYCNFFGTNKDYYTILIGNKDPLESKLFTNLEFTAMVDNDGSNIENTNQFSPTLPFDSLEVWNEYQHGITSLANQRGHSSMVHSKVDVNSLKRKYRQWHCDIPRDNAPISDSEVSMGITRFKAHPMNRIRNPWIYLKLSKQAYDNSLVCPKMELHSTILSYFAVSTYSSQQKK